MAVQVLNQRTQGDAGFIGFFNHQQFEVYAPSLLKAREIIVSTAGIPLSRLRHLTVIIAERADGSEVIHSTGGI